MARSKTYSFAYNKAVDLIREGCHHPTLEQVLESDYPSSDFSNRQVREAEAAIGDAFRKAFDLYRKAHPRHSAAVSRGETEAGCLQIWHEEGGSAYLDALGHV